MAIWRVWLCAEQRGTAVDGGVGVEQQLLEDLRALLPRLPQIAAREEARDGMAREVMDPPFLALRTRAQHGGTAGARGQ
jgi:hypothetical protein